MPYKLTVNGRAATVRAPADMPLLWVLRDILNLHGTKYGCGIGQCGACTVRLAGRPARACLTPISAVGNQSVTTIEGISENGTHPVQLAWQEIEVPNAATARPARSCPPARCSPANPTPPIATSTPP